MNGIFHPAGGTAESPLKDLLLVLLVNVKREIPLADRTAENIHE